MVDSGGKVVVFIWLFIKLVLVYGNNSMFNSMIWSVYGKEVIVY